MTNFDQDFYYHVIGIASFLSFYIVIFLSILTIYFTFKSFDLLDSLIENFRIRRLLKRELEKDSEQWDSKI